MVGGLPRVSGWLTSFVAEQWYTRTPRGTVVRGTESVTPRKSWRSIFRMMGGWWREDESYPQIFKVGVGKRLSHEPGSKFFRLCWDEWPLSQVLNSDLASRVKVLRDLPSMDRGGVPIKLYSGTLSVEFRLIFHVSQNIALLLMFFKPKEGSLLFWRQILLRKCKIC